MVKKTPVRPYFDVKPFAFEKNSVSSISKKLRARSAVRPMTVKTTPSLMAYRTHESSAGLGISPWSFR